MENKIYKLISKYDNIVIARHVGPDPDAVASQIALRDSIKLTFPKKNVYAVGTSVSRFKSYGHLDKIDASTLENPLLIVLDVPNIYRIDGVDFNIFKEVIKIDHHPYEDKMGKVEIVDTKVASTCEIVARIVFKTKLKMDKSIASNLFLGMVADSDRFLLPTTSKSTFDTASKLVNDYKIDLKNLYNTLYERPINEFKFQAYLALNMTITEKNAPVVILYEYENGLALAKKVYARYELYGYVDKDKNVVIPFSSFTSNTLNGKNTATELLVNVLLSNI